MTAPAVGPARVALDRLRSFEPESYERHEWHGPDRVWGETNCYVDLWLELLHALGCEPAALGGFAVAADFLGDQWEFFKPPPADLTALYGIEVGELNVWHSLLDHILDQGRYGRLVTVEVDAFYLPDTAGLSYRHDHDKTTITPAVVDTAARRMTYFHNAGFFALGGDDFDHIFAQGVAPNTGHLGPYIELVRLERLVARDVATLRTMATDLLIGHLRRRPADNPITAFGQRVHADLQWIATQDEPTFHAYAFAMCRQCGASAEIASSFLRWLEHPGDAAERFLEIASDAKSLQFTLARAARGRAVDPGPLLTRMSQSYDDAMGELVARYLP